MLHPSYTDLMKVVNSEVEEGETPVVNSRYSIVLATAKRARQIIETERNRGIHDFTGRDKELLSACKEIADGQVVIAKD